MGNLLVRTKTPSRYLEGDIFQTETGFETESDQNLHLIGPKGHVFMEKLAQFPYELAKLNDAGGDLSKRWCITFKVYDTRKNGLVRKQKWLSAKWKTKTARKTEADRLIRAINKLLASGYHIGKVPDKPKVKDELWTWVQAFDWVYEHRKPSLRKRSIQTMELVKTELTVYLTQEGLLHLPVRLVKNKHCDDYLQWLRAKRKIGNETYNNYMGFVKLNFNYLVKHEKLEFSPAAKLQPLKTEEPETVSFPKEVKAKLLEAYEQTAPELLILIQYMFYTFIRPGEIRQLKVKHVQNKTIFIPGHISKNRKSEHVLIMPALEKLLVKLNIRNYPAEYFLVAHDGLPGPKPTSPNFYTSKHLTIKRALGLPEIYTLYCWKHTGVTDTYRQTLDIEFVSRQCRHSSLDMTKRYLRGLGLLQEYPQRDQLPDLGL